MDFGWTRNFVTVKCDPNTAWDEAMLKFIAILNSHFNVRPVLLFAKLVHDPRGLLSGSFISGENGPEQKARPRAGVGQAR